MLRAIFFGHSAEARQLGGHLVHTRRGSPKTVQIGEEASLIVAIVVR